MEWPKREGNNIKLNNEKVFMLQISPLTLLTLSETESLNFELAKTVTGIVFDNGLSLLSNLSENKLKKVRKVRQG